MLNNAEALVSLTKNAAARVHELIEEEKNGDLKLRVYIMGGGCSGFQYGFSFEDLAEDDDEQVDCFGVTLLTDPMSIQYLVGAEIDFKEDFQGARFVVENPNAETTCGCGSSFSV